MLTSKRNVDIDRMIIHDDNPNQRFLWEWGGEEGAGPGYRARRGVGGEFRAMRRMRDTLYLPYKYKSS